MKVFDLLKSRHNNKWALISAVAGYKPEIDRLITSLTAKQLGYAFDGLATAPSKVSQLVEALAAIDCEILKMLSQDWIDPRNLKNSPYDSQEAFWTEAWSSSLRHLKRIKAIHRNYVDVPALEHEVSILWDKPKKNKVSFIETANIIKKRFLSSSNIRILASAELTEKSLSAKELQQCINKIDIKYAPLQLLRLLRGRLQILDTSAQEYIFTLLQNFDKRHPLEAAILVETAIGLEMNVLEMVDEKLVQIVLTTDDPSNIEWIVFILRRNGWCIP
ncbi:MAG: hypothetical protein GY797_30860 [Deltaproteobacteria bacterium]|nr:hypothetical protein [Deltaproteobacteria bacterium]